MTDKNTKGAVSLTISSFVFLVTGYILNLWLGRFFGPSTYGIYGVIISLMTAVNIIQTAGLPQATSKFIASEKYPSDEVLRASLWLQVISTLLITLLFFLLAKPLALILHDQSLIGYIRASSLILPLYSLYSLYIGYYNGLHNFKKQAFIYNAYNISKLVLVIGLVYVFNIYGAILGFILSPIVALLFGFHLPKSIKVEKSIYRSLILFSLPLIAFSILSTLQLSIDLFFVKSLLHDNLSAGLYTASQNIARIPYFALSSFALILLPIVAKSVHADSPGETGKKIREKLRYLFLLLIPGTILIAITSSDILQLLFSREYITAGPSLSYLAIGIGFLALFNVLTNIIIAAEKPFLTVILSGSGVIISSIFCYLLIPHFGINGAGMGTAIGAAITTLSALFIVTRRFPSSIDWNSIFKISIATFTMYCANLGLHFSPNFLPLTYIILLLLYCVILYILGEINKEDISVLRNMLPKYAAVKNPNE